jgi:hypothetical protein
VGKIITGDVPGGLIKATTAPAPPSTDAPGKSGTAPLRRQPSTSFFSTGSRPGDGLAMHDAQATPLTVTLAEQPDLMPGLAVHAVQVKMPAYPATAAQVAQHRGRHAGLDPGRFVAAFEMEIE